MVSFPGRETLAQAIGCSIKTVDKHLEGLKQVGLIRFEKRGQRSNHYRILFHRMFVPFVPKGECG